MDVLGLHQSNPIEDGITAVLEALKKCDNKMDLLGFTLTDIASVLRLILKNNYYKFGDRVVRQRKRLSETC